METKHMSLQSQTVRCQHCGEYYSVTYKYCPFCDAGRQEEERRIAEKKKQRQSKLGGFLGGQESERKKSGHSKERSGETPASSPRKSSSKRSTKAPPSSAQEHAAPPSRREARPSGAPLQKTSAREAPVREAPVRETAQATPFYRKDGRKKTSEMTPEERAAHLAQREARAAERKRAREQAARQAALTESSAAAAPSSTAPAPTPVFEDDTLPETFGLVGASNAGGGNIFDLDASSAEAAQPEDVMEVIPLYLTPDGLRESPEPEPAPAEVGQPETAEQDFLQAVNQGTGEAMSLVVGQPETTAGETVVVQAESAAPTVPPEGPLVQAPSEAQTVPQIMPQTIQGSEFDPVGTQPFSAQANAPEMGQEPPQNAVQAAPQAAVGQELPPVQVAVSEETPLAQTASQETQGNQIPVQSASAAPMGQSVPAAEQQPAMPETGEELDSLLSEIRDMLADSPVPTLSTDQLRKPPKPVAQVEITPQETPVAQQAPAAQPMPEAPVAPVEDVPAAPVEKKLPTGESEEESPTIVLPTEAIAKAAEAASASENAALSGVAVDDSPTQVLPRPPLPEEPDLLPAVSVPTQSSFQPEPQPEAEKKETRKKENRKKADKKAKKTARQAAPAHTTASSPDAPKKEKQKSAVSPLLLILSLILIAAAVFIVVKTVVPAFQDGIFSQGQGKDDPVASFTLDQTEVTVAEQGQTVTLTPIFEPEGSTLELTWSSSDETVATVDQAGLVSALAPGTATITAAAGGGQSVSCTVTCSWGEPQEQQAPVGPALSASSMTLSGEGASKQLNVTGTESTVTWTSDAPEVASVGEDGTVTAVDKGVATVTAEVDGQTLRCDIKCIW